MKNTKISQILNRLMTEKKIRVAELARQINLPQPTIHRIATGACEHPHLSSLEPIANFFSISVNQLKGFEPIPWLDRIIKVPLVAWDEVIHWPFKQNDDKTREYILTDAPVSKAGFAIKIKDDAMDPVFPKNTILIVDPNRQAKDRSFVIAKLENLQEAIFRQLLIDENDHYLKPLSPDCEKFKITRMKDTDKTLAIVVQAKRNYENE